MSRAARAFALVVPALAFGAAMGIGACGIFNDIILPVDAGPDVADGQGDVGADAPPPITSFLTREQAESFCSFAYGCGVPAAGGLGPSLSVSFDLPLYSADAPQSQFSLCMHWATEVVTPDHVGFATQQAEMRKIVDIGKNAVFPCANVALAVPILIDNPPACAGADAGTSVCGDSGAVAFCGGQVNGTALCQAPLYEDQTRCAQIFPGVASCVGGGSCTPSCDGEVAHFCTDGGVSSFNCGLFGRGCVADAGAPRCASGGACSAWKCSGQTLSSCIAGEIGPVFTCPSGTRCQTLSIGGYCETPGSECTPTAGRDHCDGANLHYCAGGRDTAFDCNSVHLGWTCRQIGTLVTCAL